MWPIGHLAHTLLAVVVMDTRTLHHDLTRRRGSAILGVVMLRRLTAAVAVLALSVGNLAVCAGWRATPEARMACCQDESTCPMHKSTGHDSAAHHHLTQAQADSCCAGSEQNESATTGSAFVASGVVALAPATVPLVVMPTVAALEKWRALVPLRPSTVPKHLLLSVFLV